MNWSRRNGWNAIGRGRHCDRRCERLPADRRTRSAAEFLHAHIPGARFLDQPGRRPVQPCSSHAAGRRLRQGDDPAGVGRDDRIIVYDNSPCAPRARLFMSTFRCERVAILDGGFQKWRSEDGRWKARRTGRARPASTHISGAGGGEHASILAATGCRYSMPAARRASKAASRTLVPMSGVGNIPGSKNLPFASLYRDDGTLRSRGIAPGLAALHIDPEDRSSPAAARRHRQFADLRSAPARRRHGKLYDGSWSEWGADRRRPRKRVRLTPSSLGGAI